MRRSMLMHDNGNMFAVCYIDRSRRQSERRQSSGLRRHTSSQPFIQYFDSPSIMLHVVVDKGLLETTAVTFLNALLDLSRLLLNCRIVQKYVST